MPAVAEQHHRTQRRQPRQFEFSGRGLAELRRKLAQHADIVRGLEALGENQRLAAHFVERVFQLDRAIGRIDIDQNEPGLGRGKLSEHPFGIVGRPDADAVAGLKPERQQPSGELVDLAAQFAVGEPHFLVAHDQRWPVRMFVADRVEELADGLADQRDFAGAVDIALLEGGHRVSSGFIKYNVARIERQRNPGTAYPRNPACFSSGYVTSRNSRMPSI